MGGVTDEVLLARAFLSRVCEPALIPVWGMVCDEGPVDTAAAVRAGRVGDHESEALVARAASADPYADIEQAARHGIRLVVPESDEWPHFGFAPLEAAGRERLRRYHAGERRYSDSGELIPPLALWVRGTLDLAPVGTRSVAIVGSRAATQYGERIAKDFAYGLARRDVLVISGGAYGIDAAAHRGALAANQDTLLVSAGGLDRPYPPSNAELFERIAASGLLVSESPPGAAPRRHRFLTRNRLIASLGTGTVVVEAAARSGAMNTAAHCAGLGRPRMAVPGPIDSGRSTGCHQLIAAEHNRAHLVASVDDVLAVIGSASDVAEQPTGRPAPPGQGTLQRQLDDLDPPTRRLFDGFPARGWVSADRLVVSSGLPVRTVLSALPMLQLVGLVEGGSDGYRLNPKLHRGGVAP